MTYCARASKGTFQKTYYKTFRTSCRPLCIWLMFVGLSVNFRTWCLLGSLWVEAMSEPPPGRHARHCSSPSVLSEVDKRLHSRPKTRIRRTRMTSPPSVETAATYDTANIWAPVNRTIEICLCKYMVEWKVKTKRRCEIEMNGSTVNPLSGLRDNGSIPPCWFYFWLVHNGNL